MFLFFVCSVFRLDDRTVSTKVLKDTKHPWMLMFGEEGNEKSQKVYRELEDAAEEGEGFARFGYCDSKKCHSLVKEMHIKDFPVLFFLYGENREVYNGPRTARGMVYYIASQIGDDIEEAQEWWPDDKADDNMVLFFTKTFKPPLMLCAAQGILKNKGITFAYTRDIDVIGAFGSPPVPSYWMYKKGEKKMYKGSSDIFTFVKEISKFFETDAEL